MILKVVVLSIYVSHSPPPPSPPSPPPPPPPPLPPPPLEPRRQFELIFKMIDVDSSGTIDVDEFERVS